MTDPEPSWTDQVREWTANYFSVSDTDGNVAALLRKAADSLDELERMGTVEVLDVTFCSDPEEEDVMVTLYFRFEDDTSDSS